MVCFLRTDTTRWFHAGGVPRQSQATASEAHDSHRHGCSIGGWPYCREQEAVYRSRRVITSFFRCCIADGVFEPNIPSNARLDDHRLDSALLVWETEDPIRFRATPQSPEFRDRLNITDADLQRMKEAWSG